MLDDIRRRAGQLAVGPRRMVSRLFGLVEDGPAVSADLLAELRIAEIQRQSEAIGRERPIRWVVTALSVVLFQVYLPWYLVIPAASCVLAADHLEGRLMAVALRDRVWGRAYWAALGAVYLSEFAFCLPASVIWHMEDAFTKAISVGVFAVAMMRLATIRSIHPATGFAGAAALASLIAVSNSLYWLSLGKPDGLAFTSLIALVLIGYLVAAILQNHRQQRLAALSRIAAQRASAAKSRFLAQMSHELRTPLNAIIGTGTSVFLTAQEARTREQMAVLLKSAEGLAVVLNDVLDLTAVEAGHIHLRPRTGDVAHEVGQTVALFRPQAGAAGLDLRLEVQDDLPARLWLDYDRLRQCLSNLLSNALKHTEQGQILVRLRFDPPDQLDIEVQDSGCGIAAGQEERIFQSYERGTPKQEGHGLGLAICRMLMDRMAGQIGLRPSGPGATFFLRLPAPVVEDAPLTPHPAPVLPDLTGVRVLVVDDIATDRLVAATYLGLLGCAAVEVAGGNLALEMVRAAHDIDVMLLDINMPGMGGLETLQQIRALPGRVGHLPLIAMTADAQDHDRRACLAAGLDGYVTKPIHLNTLRSEIARVLAARQGNVRPSDG